VRVDARGGYPQGGPRQAGKQNGDEPLAPSPPGAGSLTFDWPSWGGMPKLGSSSRAPRIAVAVRGGRARRRS